MTFLDIATDAYIKNGILAAGESLDVNLATYAMREANRLMDQWNIQPAWVYTDVIYTFALTARPITNNGVSQYWYTIGPGPATGNPAQPDFVAQRPNDIKRANLLLTTTSPAARVPLSILDSKQWQGETVPALGTAPVPIALYYDAGFAVQGQDLGPSGNGNIYLWPYPNASGNQLELLVSQQYPRFTAINDTFSFPQGFEDALMLTLAERTAEGIRDITPTLRQDAAMARSKFRALNSKSPKISTTDSGMPRKGIGTQRGSFYDGWLGNR